MAGNMNQNTRERWKTRRLMAWLCLGALLLLPLFILFQDKDWLISAAGIIQALITLFGGIIMVYIGAATLDDIKK